MATTTKPRVVRFLSEKPALRLQRLTTESRVFGNGNVQTVKPELVYEFEHGALELREGQDMLPDHVDPETGEVVEQDAVDYVRRQIASTEVGQWVIEVEPVAPDPAPVYQAVGAATARGDVEALTALGNAEYATWNREPVMDAIRAALAELNEKGTPDG